MRIGLLKLKRKITPESIKRAIEEFTSTALPTPPASERGKKRKHVSDEEDEEEEQKADQRNIYREGKYYTGKLHLFVQVCS
jgi:ribosomal protein L12E/L44/L45/RPP1/RPP2